MMFALTLYRTTYHASTYFHAKITFISHHGLCSSSMDSTVFLPSNVIPLIPVVLGTSADVL